MKVWAPPRYGRKAHNRIELSGQRFGSLLVGECVGRYSSLSRWAYTCDCGVTGVANGRDLRKGKVTCCPDCRSKVRAA